MYFVSCFPYTSHSFDGIQVIIDLLTKSAYFIPIQMTFSAERLAHIYVQKVVYLHGVSISIILDRGYVLTLTFQIAFQKDMGTQVNLSTSFHLQTDGQSEQTIQVFEDMLQARVMDFGGQWENHLSLVELCL